MPALFLRHRLLFPARTAGHFAPCEEVQAIVFYDQWEQNGGGTAVVPGLRHSVDGRLDKGSPRADPSQALYDHERQLAYCPGAVLLYTLGTWHRGTPVQLGGMRRSGHICFRTAEATWIGGDVGVGAPTAKAIHRLSEDRNVPEFSAGEFWSGLSPVQRCTLGFPGVGSRYWTAETIAAVLERYPAMDMGPYAAGMSVARPSANL